MSGYHYAEERPSKLVCDEEEARRPADFDVADETRLNREVHKAVADFNYWSGIIPRHDARGKRI